MHVWIEFVVFLLIALPITVIDIREYRIPDLLSLGGAALFVAMKLVWKEQPPVHLALQLFVGFGVFWLTWWFTKGQIGLGDAKYSAFIAVAAGLPAWLLSLLVAAATGLVCAAVLVVLLKGDRHARIPFGPFLTAGATVAILNENLHIWRLTA